jgi:hypothetical protein
MRPVLVALLAAVPAAALAFVDFGAGGDPALPTAAGLALAPSPSPKLVPVPMPELAPGLPDVPGDDDAELRALVEDATRWLTGPADGKPPTTLPPAALADAIQAARQAGPAGNGSGALAFGGGWAAGVVIPPEAHPDARPWPLGMVIRPPDVKDPMAIPPGCDGLAAPPPRRVTAGWRKPFADLAEAAEATADSGAGCPKVL